MIHIVGSRIPVNNVIIPHPFVGHSKIVFACKIPIDILGYRIILFSLVDQLVGGVQGQGIIEDREPGKISHTDQRCQYSDFDGVIIVPSIVVVRIVKQPVTMIILFNNLPVVSEIQVQIIV